VWVGGYAPAPPSLVDATPMRCGEDRFCVYVRARWGQRVWVAGGGIWGALPLWLSTQIWMSNQATNTVAMGTARGRRIRRMVFIVHGIMKGKFRRCVRRIRNVNWMAFLSFFLIQASGIRNGEGSGSWVGLVGSGQIVRWGNHFLFHPTSEDLL